MPHLRLEINERTINGSFQKCKQFGLSEIFRVSFTKFIRRPNYFEVGKNDEICLS